MPVVFIFVMLQAVLAAACASDPPPFDEALWLSRVQAVDERLLFAPHYADGVFFNPWMNNEEERKRTSGGSFLFRKKLEFEKFPEEKYAPVETDFSYLSENSNSINFVGHASFVIKMNNETILTDPFFSSNALIVPKKVKIKFNYEKLNKRPVVLISHNHYDHLDKPTIKELVKKDAVFIVPLGLKKFFTDMGAKESYELDWWEKITLGSVTYTLLPAQHWSRRIGMSGNKTLWGSFLIEGGKTIYFSGDTGYFKGFSVFGKRYAIDYALIGAGAYEPRWFMHYSHMNVEEFFRTAEDLRAKITIPMHFGVISLSDEPLTYPLYEVEKRIRESPGLSKLITPLRVGESLRMDR